MRARVLPQEEWTRLEARGSMVPFLPPEDVRPVVVEDDGQIIASVLVARVTQLEAVWVDPEHRGRPGVGRALLRGAADQIEAWGRGWALACVTPDIEPMVARMGVPLPLRPYIVAVRESP